MRRKAECRGSFTVEASLLMAILLPILVALLTLGIYTHDRCWLQNEARERALRMTVEEETACGENEVCGVLGARVSQTASLGKKYARVKVRGSYSVSGFVVPYFSGGRLSLDYTAETAVLNPKKTIQTYRNVQKLLP